MDLLQREGQYPVPPQASKILGVEFSGIIESFGDEAEKAFKVGDEVFGLAYGGVKGKSGEDNVDELMDHRCLCGVYYCLYTHVAT